VKGTDMITAPAIFGTSHSLPELCAYRNPLPFLRQSLCAEAGVNRSIGSMKAGIIRWFHWNVVLGRVPRRIIEMFMLFEVGDEVLEALAFVA